MLYFESSKQVTSSSKVELCFFLSEFLNSVSKTRAILLMLLSLNTLFIILYDLVSVRWCHYMPKLFAVNQLEDHEDALLYFLDFVLF